MVMNASYRKNSDVSCLIQKLLFKKGKEKRTFHASEGGRWSAESPLPTRDPSLRMKVTHIPSSRFGKLYLFMVP